MGVSSSKHKKSECRASDPEKVLIQLKHLEKTLKQYQSINELNMQSDLTLAKKSLRKGDKEEAKIYLKKKLYRERQLRSSNAQLDKVDQLINVLECALIQDELSNIGKLKPKVKNSKWKIFLKKKKSCKNRQRLKLYEDAEIPDIQGLDSLDHLKKKEKDKILKRIEKQKNIDNAIYTHFREDGTDVEAELEAILDADYQLPDLTRLS